MLAKLADDGRLFREQLAGEPRPELAANREATIVVEQVLSHRARLGSKSPLVPPPCFIWQARRNAFAATGVLRGQQLLQANGPGEVVSLGRHWRQHTQAD